MALAVGIGLLTGQVPRGSGRSFAQEYRDILELARRAEAAGFDSVWVSEHHGSSDGYLPSLLPILAAIAAVTERVALGTGVLLTPFHHPLRLAEDAAVVDQLSAGRLVLGLGTAWRDEEFRMFGVPKRERALRTEETIEVLRRAWTGRRFSFEGRAFRFDRVKVTPAALRPGGIPIYLGGYAEKAIRRAGRIADGYVTDAFADDVRGASAVLDDGARSAGRDPRDLALVLLQNASVVRAGDPWATVREGVAYQHGVYEAWEGGADTPDDDALQAAAGEDDALRRWTIAGSPADVTRSLRELLAPFRGRPDLHLVVRLHYPGMDLAPAAEAIDVFGAEVLPALRDA